MKFRRSLLRAVLFAAGGIVVATPGILSAQETLTVQPRAKVTWKKIVQADALQAVKPEQEPMIPPYMPGPPQREIGSSGATGADQKRAAVAPQINSSSQIAGGASVAAATLDFEALPDNNAAIPPDTHGAAGPSHLMTMLNTEVRIQSKTGAVTSTVTLKSFWSSLGGNPFDPKIEYDAIHSRWIATCDANSRSDTSKVYFAISSTSDPTGSWSFYSFDADLGDTVWADYPGFGFNTTWIAITNNMFTVASPSASRGAKMWVIDKSTALAGGVLTVTVFPTKFDLAGGVSGFALQPCVTFGSETTLYLVDNSGVSSGGTFLLRISRITGTGPAPAWSVVPGSSFGGTGLFFVANNFNYTQINAAQLGSGFLIETNDPRMLNAVFRNGKIWCTHSGGLPVAPSTSNRTAVFWYQLDPTVMPSPIVQSGVIDGGVGVHHFFPSISANSADDACVGFSRSDATRYAEAVFTGRLSTDPAGTVQPITVLKAGLDSYEKKFTGTRVRWGDYSATVVDPTDDLTFWTIQEYAAEDVGPGPNDDRWGTGWGKIVPASALPIQLASMTANVVRDHDIEVAWRTVSETNNYGFEISRKRGESGVWQTIGFTEGHGTTLTPQSYSYIERSVPFGRYYYRIRQIDLDGKSKTYPEMEVNVGSFSGKLVLAQNYPNPFNPSTVIEFAVPQSGFATMKVYNLLGQEVATLFEGMADAGKIYATRFTASSLPSGLYFYRLKTSDKVETKRMLLIK